MKKKSLLGIFFIIILSLNLRAQDTLTVSEYFKEKENCSFFILNELPKKVFKIVKSIFSNKDDVKLIIKLKNNLEIDLTCDDKLIHNEKLYKSLENWLSLSNIGFFNMQNFDTCNSFNCLINFNLKDKTAYYANSCDFYDKIIDTFNNSSSDYFLINNIIIIKDHYQFLRLPTTQGVNK